MPEQRLERTRQLYENESQRSYREFLEFTARWRSRSVAVELKRLAEWSVIEGEFDRGGGYS